VPPGSFREANVACPVGKIILFGGGEAFSDENRFALTASHPVPIAGDDGLYRVWRVVARNVSGVPANVELYANVVCVNEPS
jgi:hypothetical protein